MEDRKAADAFLRTYGPDFEKRVAGALASIDNKEKRKPKEVKGDAGRGALMDGVPAPKGVNPVDQKVGRPAPADKDVTDVVAKPQSKPVDKKALGRRRGGSAIPPDNTSTPDDLAAQQENDRILKQLFDEIPDGKKFSLKSNGGGKANYQRKGNEFVNTEGKNVTGTLLGQLKKGTWDLEKPADISAPVSVEAKKEFDLPETGVEVRYKVDGEEGEIRIIRVGDDLYEATFASGDMLQQNAETFREIAQNENWVLVSIAPTGEIIDDSKEKEGELSPKEVQLLNRMTVDLEIERELWLSKLFVKSLADLDAAVKGFENPDSDAPDFLAGAALETFLKKYDASDAVVKKVTQKAKEFQTALEIEYLIAKQRLEAREAPDVLADHTSKYYFVPGTGMYYSLMRNGHYGFSDGKGGPQRVIGKEELILLMQKEQWEECDLETFLNAGRDSKTEKGKDAPVIEAPVLPVESLEKSSLEELKSKVDEMRLEYVTTDYKQGSAWMKMKRFFGKSIGEKPGDADTDSTLERYRLALTTLQEAQLAEIKKEGLSDVELRKRMGDMLQYYKYDERVSLFKTRDQVKIESKNFGHTVVSFVENIGRQYNKLSRWQKYSIGAVCAAGVGATFLAGGGVATAAGGGIVLIRRALTTAGLAVFADAYLEGRGEKKRLETSEIQKGEDLDVLDKFREKENLSQEEYLSRLDTILKKDIGGLDEKFKKQKRGAAWRKALAWNVATFGTAGAGFLASYVGEVLHHGGSGSGTPGVDEKTAQYLRDNGLESASPAGAASAPLHAASAPSGAVSPAEVSGAGVKPADVVSQPAQVATLAPDKVSIQGRWLLKEHVVTAADGKKGLWGVLQNRLPTHIPEADQPRIVASIENLMRKDLAEMTPAERAAAGFPKGDLDKIYAGKTVIHFDQFKSLTPERIQAILDGQSVGAPSGVAVETAHVSPVNQEAFENKIAALTYQPDMPHDPLAAARAVDVANYDKMGNVREYLSTHPEKIPDFRVSLGHFREEIFLTGDVQKIMDQDYNKYLSLTSPELGKLHVTQVLRDYQALKENPFAAYDRVRNPLHFSQMQQINRLLTASGEAYRAIGNYGAIGNQVPAGATIDDLTKRLTTLGYQYQTGIPGFLKIKP
ncbi:MAG: hypothetical protein WA082_00205 [Candidatus Moraniibacteriota bacterium]